MKSIFKASSLALLGALAIAPLMGFATPWTATTAQAADLANIGSPFAISRITVTAYKAEPKLGDAIHTVAEKKTYYVVPERTRKLALLVNKNHGNLGCAVEDFIFTGKDGKTYRVFAMDMKMEKNCMITFKSKADQDKFADEVKADHELDGTYYKRDGNYYCDCMKLMKEGNGEIVVVGVEKAAA